jgi:hypothetical protein
MLPQQVDCQLKSELRLESSEAYGVEVARLTCAILIFHGKMISENKLHYHILSDVKL